MVEGLQRFEDNEITYDGIDRQDVLDETHDKLTDMNIDLILPLCNLPGDMLETVAKQFKENLAAASPEDRRKITEGFVFLPKLNLPSLVFGDEYVPLNTPDEDVGRAWMNRVLSEMGAKQIMSPLLNAAFTTGMRDVHLGFAEFAADARREQRNMYIPAMASRPGNRDQLQLTMSTFIVEPYTNIPSLQNNGRVPSGYGGSLGIQGQQNAFRYGGQLTGAGFGQETNPTNKYNATAGFATGTIGVGTHSGNRLAANVDVGGGVGFSAVDGRVGNRKIDETNWFPVVTGNMSLDIQLFQRFMRERFKLSIGAGIIAPVGRNADKLEGVPGSGPGGRGFLGYKNDLLLTYNVGIKWRLEPGSRGGGKKTYKYFN